ncbi:hypothetical protein Tco_0500246 [Tanacetum coccineum]
MTVGTIKLGIDWALWNVYMWLRIASWGKPRLSCYGSQIDITPSTLDHYYDVEQLTWLVSMLYSVWIGWRSTREVHAKGFPIFLAHVMQRRMKNKSEKKDLRTGNSSGLFLKYFLRTLPRFPRLNKWRDSNLSWLHCVAPVARAPYRLAPPSDMKEVSELLNRAIRRSVHKTQYSSPGSSSLVVKRKVDHSGVH